MKKPSVNDQPQLSGKRPRFRNLVKWVMRIVVSVGLLLCILVAKIYIVTPEQRMERTKVNQRVFDTIKQNTKWNMDSNMLYGYYFTNKRKFPLMALSYILRLGGLRLVDIHQDEESKLYWLHVEKIEIEGLNAISIKDVRLQRIGKLFLKSDYDGWDVGADLTPTNPQSGERRTPVD